ncbi:MAG TPA: hypothetical protein VGN26_11390 [Armatimonadota bacterium]
MAGLALLALIAIGTWQWRRYVEPRRAAMLSQGRLLWESQQPIAVRLGSSGLQVLAVQVREPGSRLPEQFTKGRFYVAIRGRFTVPPGQGWNLWMRVADTKPVRMMTHLPFRRRSGDSQTEREMRADVMLPRAVLQGGQLGLSFDWQHTEGAATCRIHISPQDMDQNGQWPIYEGRAAGDTFRVNPIAIGPGGYGPPPVQGGQLMALVMLEETTRDPRQSPGLLLPASSAWTTNQMGGGPPIPDLIPGRSAGVPASSVFTFSGDSEARITAGASQGVSSGLQTPPALPLTRTWPAAPIMRRARTLGRLRGDGARGTPPGPPMSPPMGPPMRLRPGIPLDRPVNVPDLDLIYVSGKLLKSEKCTVRVPLRSIPFVTYWLSHFLGSEQKPL